MRRVTIEEAERSFHELLEAAREGEAVEITDGGEPVARVVPANGFASAPGTSAAVTDPLDDDELERRLAAAEAAGIIKRGKPGPPLPPLQSFGPPFAGALDALIEERRTGR